MSECSKTAVYGEMMSRPVERDILIASVVSPVTLMTAFESQVGKVGCLLLVT